MKNRSLMLKELQNKLNVCFNNINFLDTALTHSSYANGKTGIEFNERIEFLGDSVLQLTISEYLFAHYTNKNEGELTKVRSLIVCENSLYAIAKGWELGQYIRMSSGEELTGGRTRISILADCIEAIIAAVYIDQGFEIAKEFILKNFKSTIEKAIKNEIVLDYKTTLQETLQKNGDVSIEYKLVKFEGPPHRRKFFVDICINDEHWGSGEGYSKKEAEQNAAKTALERLRG
jgi:ribonuclease III